MKWFKCSNTIVLNPKLGFVAKISKSYKHEVIAAWLYLLSEASKNQEKGNLGQLHFESMDYALDFLPNKSRKIYEALVGNGMIENNTIVGWVEYQCDPTAAERQRKSRALKAEVSQPVTVCHSDITESHAVTVEERRGEEIREEENDDDDKELWNFLESTLQGRVLVLGRYKTWQESGADNNLIKQVVLEVLARNNGKIPSTLNYFDKAIANAVEQKNKPMPKGELSGTPKQNTGQGYYPAKQSVTDATREAYEAAIRGEL